MSSALELLNGPLNRNWRVRSASFTGPDGHICEIAKKLPVTEEP